MLGGFDQESYQLLIKKPNLINKLAQQILSEHFPDNVQDVIANRLDFPLQEIRQNRDPTFRKISYVLTIISVLYAVIIYVMIAPWLA